MILSYSYIIMTSPLFLPSPDHFHTSSRLIPTPSPTRFSRISLSFPSPSPRDSIPPLFTPVTAFLFYLSPRSESGKRNHFSLSHHGKIREKWPTRCGYKKNSLSLRLITRQMTLNCLKKQKIEIIQ